MCVALVLKRLNPEEVLQVAERGAYAPPPRPGSCRARHVICRVIGP
jgi:hypothetical protein